ncbi:TPA: hypothetical protein UM674_002200 [Stenotrophomonas maltophilia]|nr:hypothetical protein [Stenotrophomonas maltophilia]
MHHADIDQLPTPMTGSLDDLLDSGDSTEKAFKVFVGHNLGHRTFLLQIPMHEFFQISEVANDAGRDGEDAVTQRKLDTAHAQKLATYILKGLVQGAIVRRSVAGKGEIPALSEILDGMGRQPYMSLQPLVANIREMKEGGRSLRAERILSRSDGTTVGFNIYLSQQHVLWVIDGQHRRWAMRMVFDYLDTVIRTKSYPKKGSLYGSGEVDATELTAWQEVSESSRSFCTVSAEVHMGLNPEQERQLFHDLNNLGKKVDRNLALKFDNSNPINLFIKDTLHEELSLSIVEKEVKEWRDDEGAITLKDAVAVNAILFLNKTNIAGATPTSVKERAATAKSFWEAVKAIPGFGEVGAKEKTVSAQPVVLKAIAKLVFDFGFSNRRPENGDQLLDRLLSSLTDLDFSHENPMWRYYEMQESDRDSAGLAGLNLYLPQAETGNRDIGSYQGGVMRFGAKHNDIYPILGDMIRWSLDLPNRHI